MLKIVVADFWKRHGRHPTFWFDKVCTDQDNIADGLRVLPVNVMACSTFLMLVGETYLKRLWCAWELCLLLAFMDMEEVMDRLHVVALHCDVQEVSQALQEFNIDTAH